MSTPIDDMSNPLIFEEEVQESPIYIEEAEYTPPVKRRSTPSIERFSETPVQVKSTFMGQTCKPNYMIFVWLLVSSVLANLLPDSVIAGLSAMVPSQAAMIATPLTRAVATVAIYALLNFLLQ
jgi:hypothetical protein